MFIIATLEEIDISKTNGIKRELLIIARNRTIRQLQKSIDDLDDHYCDDYDYYADDNL